MTLPLNNQDTLHNHMRFGRGATHFSADFGGVHSITAISLTGPSHHPHVEVRFTYGLRLDLEPDVFAELIRRGPSVLAKLHFSADDIHDHVGEEQL